MIPNEAISTFKDLDDSSRCVTVASSYGHSKVSSYLKEMLAQNAEEKEEWDDAEYEDKFCDIFTLLKLCAWKFYTHIELHWIFILRLYYFTQMTFMKHQIIQFYINFCYTLFIYRTVVFLYWSS